ncbi:Oidioi.mRNA.OKI2018_I69.chr2.g6231.t1.cds [Oikopleura dioica]|uniref:Oidioi.mRNA.OKI2018_I69.chr2.g6231.t1.cds n=1 Tax=Oikopleura dioica TaxID=34765 RepID=A0ABN7T399_OIKDI|nr:Oidioi.mRNA.OKI2018_I69.chr2.g6231.t1.cds [Oikopleura dioica]
MSEKNMKKDGEKDTVIFKVPPVPPLKNKERSSYVNFRERNNIAVKKCRFKKREHLRQLREEAILAVESALVKDSKAVARIKDLLKYNDRSRKKTVQKNESERKKFQRSEILYFPKESPQGPPIVISIPEDLSQLEPN